MVPTSHGARPGKSLLRVRAQIELPAAQMAWHTTRDAGVWPPVFTIEQLGRPDAVDSGRRSQINRGPSRAINRRDLLETTRGLAGYQCSLHQISRRAWR